MYFSPSSIYSNGNMMTFNPNKTLPIENYAHSMFSCLFCLAVISCRQLRQIGEKKNHSYPDGVYKIYPTGSQPIMAYCDMSSDGGGWTLLVASHTNSWTAQNVKLRNPDSPKLNDDYSILEYADSIKDNINVAGSKFEYRLEAQSRGNVLSHIYSIPMLLMDNERTLGYSSQYTN